MLWTTFDFRPVNAWEKRKLGELSNIRRGASPRPISSKKWFSETSSIGWLRISDVTEQNGRIYHVAQHLSKEGQEKTLVLTTKHLILSIAATVGKPVQNYIALGIHDGFIVFLNPKFDLDFMFYFLEDYQPKWSRFGQPGSQVNINSELVRELEINVPREDEQKKISHVLLNVDNLIAATQDKLDCLERVKKALLQHLFDQSMRFKGYSDPWEKRKFADMLDPTDGIRRGPFGSALKKDSFVKHSPFVIYEQQNAIYNRFSTRYNISEEKFQKLQKFEVLPGDFILSGAGTIGKIARVPKGIKRGVFNQALIRLRIDKATTDSEFFLQFLRSDAIQKKLTETNPGSAIHNLVPMTELKQWNVFIPRINEQQSISCLLKRVDDLIAATQSKLSSLETLKKALLQGLFI